MPEKNAAKQKSTFMTKVVCFLAFAAFPAAWYQLTEATGHSHIPDFLLITGYILVSLVGLVVVWAIIGGGDDPPRNRRA